MAIRIENKVTIATSGTPIVPDMPAAAQETGDVFFLTALNDAGNNPVVVTGWTEIAGAAPNNQSRCSCWYIIHTGVDITAPSIIGTSNDWIIDIELTRDADITDLINQAARVDVSPADYVFPTPPITTTKDNCLVYRIYGMDQGNIFSPSYCYGVTSASATEITNNIVLYSDVETVGAAKTLPSLEYNHGNAIAGDVRFGTTYAIAFNNKSGGRLEPSVNAIPIEIANYSAPPTVYNLSTIRPTLLGASTAAVTINSTARRTVYTPDLNWYGGYTRYTVTPSATLAVQGLAKDITSTDMSVYLYSISFVTPLTFLFSDAGPLFYFEDSAGNWVLWQPLTEAEGGASFKTLIAFMPDETFVDSSGVIDWTDIVITGLAHDVVSTSTGPRVIDIACECMIKPAVCIGGHVDNPITPTLISDIFNTGLGIYRSRSNGNGQEVIATSVELGDLVTPTHFVGKAESLAYPEDGTTVLLGYTCGDNTQSYTVKTSATCIMDFRSWITRSANLQLFSIDSSANTNASFLTTGWILSGFNLVWKTGIACPNANFLGCGVLDIKSAEFVGGSVSGSISTTHAMTATDGATIGYDFTKGAETYAIELSSVDGNYDLSQATFNGYTKELNVTAATGTTTINLSSGQPEPTYDTAGATVVFATPVIEGLVSITNMVVGSRLEIINETKGTKPHNDIVVSSSFSDTYTDGTTYSNGDLVTIRINYYSTVTAKKEFSQSVIVTSNGWSVLADQVDDTVYNSIMIDGGIITKFQADYVNDEVDLVVGEDFSGAEFYAWWVANGSTAQGIDEFFGGVTAIDEANIRINNSIVDMYFDNTTSTNLKQVDNRRIYREDGAYPVKNPTTGGGGIDIVWRNQVFIAGLEEISISEQDKEDIAIRVWNEEL